MDTDPAAEPQTATLESARAHARSLAGTTVASGPTVPSTAATGLPLSVVPDDVIWDETVAAGGYAARVLPHGAELRITDADGDACVQLLAYNAANTAERLNVADTVKVQWQAYLGAGAQLLSDMGRVLLTVVDDTSGRHDCLCGATNRRANDERYGDGRVSGPTPNAHDLLVLAGAKHGLDRVDIAPNINLFKGVRVADDGALTFDGDPRPGTHLRLLAEMDTLVLVANTPHALDDRPDYTGSTVRLTAWQHAGAEPGAGVGAYPATALTPERQRALLNTAEYLLEVGR